MNKPLVSICIPTYNGQEFLDQCIQSCLAQTFSDYEILICDDGSKDSTADIIETYCKKSTKIRFVKNPVNLGLVENWNKCITEASGSWIKFVFQDDFISPDCLQEFVTATKDGAQLLVSERNFILPVDASEDVINYYSKVVRTLQNSALNTSTYYSPQLLSSTAVKHFGMNFIGEPSLLFFKKDITNDLGLFNPALKQICDFEFALRAGTNVGLTLVPKKLCSFRIHAHTTTAENVNANYFILRYIEPLLLAYFMLYGSHFSAFRANLGFIEKAKLKLSFKVKAYNAYLVNQTEKRNHYLFRDDLHEFKAISKYKKGTFFVRLISKRFR